MKTTVKQLAAVTFIAFLLLIGKVNANGTETKASGRENIETTLHLEKWMTEEANWNTNSSMFAEFVQETDAKLEFENWMVNAESWNLNNILVEEVDPGLEFEDWMICEAKWENVNNENEPKLVVEPWMINEKLWK